MKCTVSRSIFHNLLPPNSPSFSRIYVHFTSSTRRRRFGTVAFSQSPEVSDERMVVVGGGAAGIYGAIRAKTLAPNLNVVVIEKGKPLAKVKVSGGGRCNVTNGHCADNMILAEQYPRGSREFRGSFFNVHGPGDTMSWFSDHGVKLKGYNLATQLGHSIIKPVPSLFTFKIDDTRITELSGITFPKVKASLKLESLQKNIPQLTQVGPMLVTHWGLSGPVILRLSAWGARDLYSSDYKGTLLVDFSPDLHSEDLKSLLSQHKKQFPKQKVVNSYPPELGLMKRFWRYLLNREGIDEDILWASISNNSLMSVASLLKQCSFIVKGKGQFKDEFVTAGGVPLSEISLKTMESRIQSHLFFAGEVLNVDGITGGFNFQNAWSGGYIAGTSIGKMAAASAPATLKELAM
ncbi:uncharacterized protein LOC112512444 isoform X4 [Cynara cardunculus var. scolymus]|uniref:uncharacterized protein LOC112512444 isoform X4 n=1 Tax=Cynara cardunculus var. scolymus TaxID=59895 RepID=UPI000D6297E1|nr:uncharacterized protein LOC112512444 isoform X4 [Cynara cardunculus var. scolymus]